MAADSLRYRRRFALAGALVTIAEVWAVVSPLWAFFSPDERQRQLLAAAAPPVVGVAWLLWWAAMRWWRRPVDRAVARRRAGEALEQTHAQAAYQAMLALPRRLGWLRAVLAGAVGLTLAALLVARTGFRPEWMLTVTMVCFLHVLLLQVFRVILYARILAGVRDALIADIDRLRLFRDQYFPRLIREDIATGVVGAVAIGAIAYFFLPINLEQYLRLETWYPLTTFFLTAVWIAVTRRMTVPIERYIDAAAALNPRDQPAADDPRAFLAYRTAQMLPYKLAVVTAAFWLVGEVLLSIESTLLFGVDLENSLLLFAAALVVTVGVALYGAFWHRATVRPLLVHLATRHRLRLEAARTPLSLRNKMLFSFGGLTFFVCGLSLFGSFVQFKNLVTESIQQTSELRLDALFVELQAAAARLGRPLAPADVERTLADAARAEPESGSVIYYVSPTGDFRPRGFGGGRLGPLAPELPWTGEAVMRRLERGHMELTALHLSGAYARFYDGAHRDLGAIAVLRPGYRGRGQRLRGLLFFSAFLVVASLGFVVLGVTDLTKPIRLLEKRAGAMARGDLSHPVIHSAGEADEVGRLTFAFEEMRRALNDKLRSSTEINLSLEQEVRRRTAELEGRNQELKGALEALQRTQAELVRSEKMASMGRLVAGIAHEINNPVNAVVNTAAPLESTLEDLMSRPAGALSPAEAAEAFVEVREMIRVIQRGARRTKEIVQALHNYSRGDDDRLVDVDLHRGIDESLDLLRHHLKHGVTVERQYGDVGRVRGYAGQLHQVFMNLLTNAAQALGEAEERGGGRVGVIRIATSRQADKAVITVADNGPGIPAELLPRIFDPFFTTKDVGQGSGLGLSIVHGIVERHGGTIAVDSQVGRGTTFTVTLPAG